MTYTNWMNYAPPTMPTLPKPTAPTYSAPTTPPVATPTYPSHPVPKLDFKNFPIKVPVPVASGVPVPVPVFKPTLKPVDIQLYNPVAKNLDFYAKPSPVHAPHIPSLPHPPTPTLPHYEQPTHPPTPPYHPPTPPPVYPPHPPTPPKAANQTAGWWGDPHMISAGSGADPFARKTDWNFMDKGIYNVLTDGDTKLNVEFAGNGTVSWGKEALLTLGDDTVKIEGGGIATVNGQIMPDKTTKTLADGTVINDQGEKVLIDTSDDYRYDFAFGTEHWQGNAMLNGYITSKDVGVGNPTGLLGFTFDAAGVVEKGVTNPNQYKLNSLMG